MSPGSRMPVMACCAGERQGCPSTAPSQDPVRGRQPRPIIRSHRAEYVVGLAGPDRRRGAALHRLLDMLVTDKGEGSSQPLFSETRLRQARNDPGLRGVLPLVRGGQGGLVV